MRWHAHVRIFPALLTILVPFFLSCPGLLAQRSGVIIGQVRLPGGALLPQRVLVTLQLRGAPTNSTFTDNEGRFSFSQLMPAVYHVVVKEEGYYPASQRARVDPDVSTTTLVRIILRRRERGRPEQPPTPAVGGNPHLVDVADYAKQFPRQAVKEFEAGVKANQLGKANQAMKHYQKSVELAPDFYPAHNNLGTIYVTQGNFEAAEGEFAQVIELNHNDAQAYFNLGNVFCLTQRYSDAERTLREGLKREPGSAFGNYLLGSAHARLGKLDQAERSLRAALELDPEMSSIRLELANLYLQQGRTTEAIAELKIFAKESPTHPMRPKVEELLEKLESSNPTDL